MRFAMRFTLTALPLLFMSLAVLIPPGTAGSPAAAATSDPVIGAAGDIACDESQNAGNGPGDGDDYSPDGCKQRETAALLKSAHLAAILPLGDEQYDRGTLAAFRSSFAKTWGAAGVTIHPVPGNHEYLTLDASGYYTYFGAAAGDPSKGYYSWNLGGWHFIAINGNCWAVGGCNAGSPQELWLKADLTSHHAACILSYWHQPRFSSGLHHSDVTYEPLWDDLYAAHADIVLNGHDHDYERFAPQTPTGEPSSSRGIREFVVGTGGKSHYPFRETAANSVVRDNRSYGVLELTLHATSYDWKFVHATGTFTDSGSGTCHAKPAA
jgi:acid phosphatase type 7